MVTFTDRLTHLMVVAALTLLCINPTAITADTDTDDVLPPTDHADNLVIRVTLGKNNYASFDCAHASFGPRFPMRRTLEFMLAEPSPKDGCSPIHSSYSSALIMLRSHECEDVKRVSHANNAKAKLAIIRSNVPGEGAAVLDPDSDNHNIALNIPTCIMSFSDGQRLIANLETYGEVDAAIPGAPLKRIKIEISTTPSLSVIHPGNEHVTVSPGTVLPIQWTSTHSRAVKITLLQGHSTNPQQSWTITDSVEAPDFDNTPGTWRLANKTSHKFVYKTHAPTIAHPCVHHTSAIACEGDPAQNCRWNDNANTQSSCVPYTPRPTTSKQPLFEYEHEKYTEYEFVPGETPMQIFEWTVPNDYPADRFYTIRVSYVDHPDIFADSNGYFTINGKSSLVITHPSAQQLVFFHNVKYNATWNTHIHPNEDKKHSLTRVKLFLMSFNKDNNERLKHVQELTPRDAPGVVNNGWFEFTVPTGLDPHGRYYLRIETTDRSVFDVSDYYFRIEKNDIVLKSFLPDTSQAVEMGKTVPIEWTWGGHLEKVSISLVDNNPNEPNSEQFTIASNVVNTGKFDWLVRSGTPAGTHFTLRITDADDNRYFVVSEEYFAVRMSLFDLRIVHPNPSVPGDAIYFTGETMQIKWQTSGPFANNDRLSVVVFGAGEGNDIVHDSVARLVSIRNNAIRWEIPAHYIVEGEQQQFYIQLISENDGMSVTTTSPITIKRSALTLVVPKDGVNMNNIPKAKRPQAESWLHTIERSFAVNWKVTGYINHVFVYFYCVSEVLEQEESNENDNPNEQNENAIKVMVKPSGEAEVSSEDTSAPDFFDRYAISSDSKKETLHGWLPLTLDSNNIELNESPYKCSLNIENAGDAAMVNSVKGLYLDALPSMEEWTELIHGAKQVDSKSDWVHFVQPSNNVEFYVKKTTKTKQFADPEAFKSKGGWLSLQTGGISTVGIVLLTLFMFLFAWGCWMMCRRMLRSSTNSNSGFQNSSSAKVMANTHYNKENGSRRPSILMNLVKHAVGSGGPVKYHRGAQYDTEEDASFGANGDLQMMSIAAESERQRANTVSPKHSRLHHRGSFSQVDGQEGRGVGGGGIGGRRGSRSGYTGVPVNAHNSNNNANTTSRGSSDTSTVNNTAASVGSVTPWMQDGHERGIVSGTRSIAQVTISTDSDSEYEAEVTL